MSSRRSRRAPRHRPHGRIGPLFTNRIISMLGMRRHFSASSPRPRTERRTSSPLRGLAHASSTAGARGEDQGPTNERS